MNNRLISASCLLVLMGASLGLVANGNSKRVAESVMEVRDKTTSEQVEVVAPRKIGRDEIKAKIDSGKKTTLVDALPEQYFNLSHLANSINIPYEQCDQLTGSLLPDKKAEIIVYCMDSK